MPNKKNLQDQAQIIYFSHGGGPLPILGDASHKAMIDFMLQLPSRLRKPDAILVISAHWEEKARLSKADGEATAVEELEIARAEAEVAMIQAILDGIQRARRSGAATRTSEIVALRLIDGLERMAEQSRHKPNMLTLLTELDELRSDLATRAINSTSPLPE